MFALLILLYVEKLLFRYFNQLNKSLIVSNELKSKRKKYKNLNIKKVPTVSDHAGLVSVELDYFCDFGAELNFFVKLRRTISSNYMDDGRSLHI